MAFENLISLEFSSEELTELDNALKKIEDILHGKTHNLTTDERRQYGSIAEQNKLFVNKAKTYMEQYPDLVPRYIDKAEFDRDYAAREAIETRYMRIHRIQEQFSDTKVLLDHDNYQAALSFYRNIRVLSQENVPGTKTVANDLKQFFARTSKRKGADADALDTERNAKTE